MSRTRNAISFLVLLAFVVAVQWFGGAYQAEFAEDSDESGHYVTGLMLHDYFAAGLPWPPMEFAQRFHNHYPRVALGHWPPLFYVLQAAWMSVFHEGRASMLLFIAVIAALWALLCLNLFARFMPGTASWVAVVFLLCTTEALRSSRMVMSDSLMALLILAGLCALARLIDHPGWKWSVIFGLLASAAIFTKGTGVLLAPLPLLAVFALRRWDLLKSPWFWLPALIVLATCGPWYTLAPYALHEKAGRFGSPGIRDFRMLSAFRYMGSQFTWPFFALAMTGWLRTAARIFRGEEKSGFWALGTTIIPAAWAFHVSIGAWHARHLLAIFPFTVLFAAIAFEWLLTLLPARPTAFRPIAAVLLLAFAGYSVASMPKKPHRGMDQVAAEILRRPEFAKSRLMVASTAAGEGAFVTEIAMGERRPGHYVQRSYKELAQPFLIGRHATATMHGPEETMNHFRKQPGTVLIYDPASNRDVNGKAIAAMLGRYPNQWRDVFAQPGTGTKGEPIRVLVQVAVLGQ